MISTYFGKSMLCAEQAPANYCIHDRVQVEMEAAKMILWEIQVWEKEACLKSENLKEKQIPETTYVSFSLVNSRLYFLQYVEIIFRDLFSYGWIRLKFLSYIYSEVIGFNFFSVLIFWSLWLLNISILGARTFFVGEWEVELSYALYTIQQHPYLAPIWCQ